MNEVNVDFTIISGDVEMLDLVDRFNKNTLTHIVMDNGTSKYFKGSKPIMREVFEQICFSKLKYVSEILGSVEDFRAWFIGNVNICNFKSDKLKKYIIKKLLTIGYEYGCNAEELMLISSKIFRAETMKKYGDDGCISFYKAIYYGDI